LKVLVNGKEVEKFHLIISIEKDGDGYCGVVECPTLMAKIKNELPTKQVGSLYHIYDTDKGRVTVEFIDVTDSS